MDLCISTNLVGIKGAAGSRKRQHGGYGGWRSGRQEALFPRQGWRQARRHNLRLGQGMIAAKSKDILYTVDRSFLVDRYSKEQDIQVCMLEDSLDTSLQQMEVDTVDRTESQVDSVWCQWRQQNVISDKSNVQPSEYWAKEFLVSGEGEVAELHPHHPEDEADHHVHHQLPEHVDQVHIGHVKDKPGKPNKLYDLNVLLPGSYQHEGADDTGQEHHGPADEVQQEQGAVDGMGVDALAKQEHQCACVVPGGLVTDATCDNNRPAGDDHGHGQLTAQGEGHHDGVQEKGQVHDRVRVGGVDAEEQQRGGGALARVKDGYGGAKPRRSYWRRKGKVMVPDGLVQRRIFQFTRSVGEHSGGGEVSRFGKRKWGSPEPKNLADVTKLTAWIVLTLGTRGYCNI